MHEWLGRGGKGWAARGLLLLLLLLLLLERGELAEGEGEYAGDERRCLWCSFQWDGRCANAAEAKCIVRPARSSTATATEGIDAQRLVRQRRRRHQNQQQQQQHASKAAAAADFGFLPLHQANFPGIVTILQCVTQASTFSGFVQKLTCEHCACQCLRSHSRHFINSEPQLGFIISMSLRG